MKTLSDYYYYLYKQSDVLLFTDVFENFRDVCSDKYGIDPAWYYTAPGLAWDAALKITDVKLGLCSIVFFNRGQKWWRKLNRIATSSVLLQNGTYI